jgi:hypothetical protein
MTSVSVVTDTMGDEQRRRGLRQMRLVALGLLAVRGGRLCPHHLGNHDGVWGFVNAAAEASMVGALADWFAVTALFRHPMGLPIPHTALIPKKKDMLARSLQDFVGDNFLRGDHRASACAAAHGSARRQWLGPRAGQLAGPPTMVVGVTIAVRGWGGSATHR